MTLDLPELIVADAQAWSAWLAEAPAGAPGVWLVLARKGTTDPTSLTYDQALDEALCHGWIDGQKRARDAATFRQRFTPRRPRSTWSQRNVGLVADLIAQGRMQPAGQAAIDAAKADGRWEAAYHGQASIPVPEDLQAALDAEPRAATMFGILTSQNRYAILFRIEDARAAKTRADRIATYVAMLAEGRTLHPQRRSLTD